MDHKTTDLPKHVDEVQFLEVNQVCKFLKVSKSTLYGLISRTKNPLPSVKLGKSRRFPLDKLRWWMDNLEN